MAQQLTAFFLLLLVLLASARKHEEEYRHDEDEEDQHRRRREEDEDDEGYDRHEKKHHKKSNPFVLSEPVRIIKTEAGDVQVLPGPEESSGALVKNNIGLSIISMEPKALLLPQYVDASCVLYVHKGQLTLGWVEQDKLNKRDLKTGDVYALPGGLVFYILNTDEGQRLRVYAMCDTSESLESGHFQSFFVGGGDDPPTILSGFDKEVLGAALKVNPEDVSEFLSSQTDGPIIYTTRSEFEFLRSTTSNSGDDSAPKPFSLLEKTPDFKNENGWTIAVDGDEFSPLKKAHVGVFAVSLKPGAMLAPHWNPRAAEVAFVTAGHGSIQVSYPNGTNALNKKVDEDTVFFVPRYFPMCQIASRDGPFEFVGFSTSSKPNRPQFLAGSNSVFKAFKEVQDVLSKAFGIPVDRLKEFLENQGDAVILPGFIEEEAQEEAPEEDESTAKTM